MKLKSTITVALAAVMLAGVTSCEDMLRVDSKVVMYDYQNTLNHATDTVYSVMGIIKQLQKIADRSIIMGELRGDLVTISDHASDDLRDLYNYNFASLRPTNKYNNPADYYAVINNCNYFLAKVDTTYERNHKNVFLREYITVLSYRAWTYLQLAQIYGKVYYIDKPVLSGDMNSQSWEYMDIKTLADTLLAQFDDKYLDEAIPSYGSLGGYDTGDGRKAESHASTDLFIPVRLIMGDLCLWAGKYDRAALYYHDFLSRNEIARPTNTSSILWFDYEFIYLGDDTYAQTFGKNFKPICYIPMEAEEYSGTISELPDLFNSTKNNDNWYQLTRSQALTQLSARQNYCYHFINTRTDYFKPVYQEKSNQDNVLLKGDLRLQSILDLEDIEEDEFSSLNLGTKKQTLNKINSEKICLYRDDVVYLRLAEALNRAKLPQSAFAVLKYGLCKQVIDTLISRSEKDRAAAMGMSNVYVFNENKFSQAEVSASAVTREFDGVKYTTDYTNYLSSGANSPRNTIGIHSRGSGDASLDTTYTIGKKLAEMGISTAAATLTDSIRAVEEYLIDEMALETCFEGNRFGDLLRISMHRAEDIAEGAFADNDFLTKRVASRGTATLNDPFTAKNGIADPINPSLYDDLLGDGSSFNAKWFLRLTGNK